MDIRRIINRRADGTVYEEFWFPGCKSAGCDACPQHAYSVDANGDSTIEYSCPAHAYEAVL